MANLMYCRSFAPKSRTYELSLSACSSSFAATGYYRVRVLYLRFPSPALTSTCGVWVMAVYSASQAGPTSARRCPSCYLYKIDSEYQVENHKKSLVHRCPENEDGTAWRCTSWHNCSTMYLIGHPDEKLRRQIEKKEEAREREEKRINDQNYKVISAFLRTFAVAAARQRGAGTDRARL